MSGRVLFVTWDGPQVSYLEGLFVPIFKALGPHGYQFHVLQFTWGLPKRIAAAHAACADSGIPYRAAPIWRRLGGLGPFASAVAGARHIRRAVQEWTIDILMPRSLMPALATLAMRARRGVKVVFDADGLAADERVDFAGLSADGATYRILRDIEAQLVRRADGVLVRSSAARDILLARGGPTARAERFTVVSNGRDPAPYQTQMASPRDAKRRPLTLCYAGSIGVQYRPDLMLRVASGLRTAYPDLLFRVFTGTPENLEHVLSDMEISDRSWIKVEHRTPESMPEALAACDLALAFRQTAFSTRAVAPIKLGEYLLAGLPVIGTAGVGDTGPLVEADVFMPSDGDNMPEIVRWVADLVIADGSNIRDRCHRLGMKHFSLDRSVEQYREALNKV